MDGRRRLMHGDANAAHHRKSGEHPVRNFLRKRFDQVLRRALNRPAHNFIDFGIVHRICKIVVFSRRMQIEHKVGIHNKALICLVLVRQNPMPRRKSHAAQKNLVHIMLLRSHPPCGTCAQSASHRARA